MGTARILLVIACLVAFCSTGVFGSGFINKYNYERIKDAKRLIEIAKGEIGIREITPNRSKRIDEYARYVGLREIPWCAAFCSWCLGQAGYKEPKTAWCPALFPANRIARDALPGMVIGIYFPSKNRIAHCGILISIKDDWCEVVEGNTNVAGSREGDAVMQKLRHKRTIAKYADWL